MQIAAIMSTELVTVHEQAPLDRALALMDEHRLRHLPVLEGGRLVGIVSDRDLLHATGWLPARVHEARGPGVAEHLPHSVGEILHAPVETVAPEAELEPAAARLLHLRVGCLPVVREGRLVGMLTTTDVLAWLAEGGGSGATAAAIASSVREHMTADPVTIHWFATLRDALDLCRERGVRHLPVLEADQLAGIVSDRDLRRALGSGRSDQAPLEEIMTMRPVVVGPEQTLAEACGILASRRIGALPVVERDELVGILSLSDVFDCLADRGGPGGPPGSTDPTPSTVTHPIPGGRPRPDPGGPPTREELRP